MTNNKWNQSLLQEQDDSSSGSSVDTKSEDLFDFETQAKKLRQRAERVKQNNNRLAYYADDSSSANLESSIVERPRDELKDLRYQIPRNIEERIRERQRQVSRKNLPEQANKKLNKSKTFMDLNDEKQMKLKNEFHSGVDLNVSLDLLDTSELLGYYKTVVSKSKKDLIVHQKQQNYLKKLDIY